MDAWAEELLAQNEVKKKQREEEQETSKRWAAEAKAVRVTQSFTVTSTPNTDNPGGHREPSIFSPPQREANCRFYEPTIVDIVEKLLESSTGEVNIPCEGKGSGWRTLKPATLKLNLREARNGFMLGGICSEQIRKGFDLGRLEFSVSRTCYGVTVKDRERYTKPRQMMISQVSIKPDYDIIMGGFFNYTPEVAEAWLVVKKALTGSSSGSVKFRCTSEEQTSAIKQLFAGTCNVRVHEGFFEVLI